MYKEKTLEALKKSNENCRIEEKKENDIQSERVSDKKSNENGSIEEIKEKDIQSDRVSDKKSYEDVSLKENETADNVDKTADIVNDEDR